jgi:hypothetical protein
LENVQIEADKSYPLTFTPEVFKSSNAGILMLERISELPAPGWKKVSVKCAGNKHRILRVYDEQVFLKEYDKDIRQITITGNGEIKPAVIITSDFDLTMSILAHNLYRLFALELKRYSNLSIQSLYDKFVLDGADIIIRGNTITVQLKKKRNLPQFLEVM